MVQGTSSFAGKSLIAAALCRIFADRGLKVAPFKAQNTSLNSAVTPEGAEIARSQALQAMAARVEPESAMNPILLKPMGESRAQIVVRGRPYKDIEAWDYYRDFAMGEGLGIVEDAYRELEKRFDLIVMEGAGSPAEINLYDRDITNMRVARMAGSPVLLVADIDRGGVFASIYGTLALLPEEDKKRVFGVVINKFRGDIKILEPGIEQIEELTGVPVLGVVPFIEELDLPEEDSMGILGSGGTGPDVAVVRLPRISNFTDFDALRYAGCRVRYVKTPSELGQPDVVVIPGTKDTIGDLEWLEKTGMAGAIKALKGKAVVVGICGGFQLLGKTITDRTDRSLVTAQGLGLLDVETVFEGYEKTTEQVEGEVISTAALGGELKGAPVRGYEIHMGRSALGEGATPFIRVGEGTDGAIDESGTVMGTYFHGLFDSPEFRESFLANFPDKGTEGLGDVKKEWERSLARLAEVVRDHIDMEALEDVIFG
jgi:adenosylcobyric acid synthase